MGDEKPIRWDGSESSAFRRAANHWTWLDQGEGEWAKDGECPRCHAGVSITRAGEVVLTLDRMVEADLELMEKAEEGPVAVRGDDGDHVYARCNCGEEHPGRPSSLKTGCGAWAYIDPPPEDGDE